MDNDIDPNVHNTRKDKSDKACRTKRGKSFKSSDLALPASKIMRTALPSRKSSHTVITSSTTSDATKYSQLNDAPTSEIDGKFRMIWGLALITKIELDHDLSNFVRKHFQMFLDSKEGLQISAHIRFAKTILQCYSDPDAIIENLNEKYAKMSEPNLSLLDYVCCVTILKKQSSEINLIPVIETQIKKRYIAETWILEDYDKKQMLRFEPSGNNSKLAGLNDLSATTPDDGSQKISNQWHRCNDVKTVGNAEYDSKDAERNSLSIPKLKSRFTTQKHKRVDKTEEKKEKHAREHVSSQPA